MAVAEAARVTTTISFLWTYSTLRDEREETRCKAVVSSARFAVRFSHGACLPLALLRLTSITSSIEARPCAQPREKKICDPREGGITGGSPRFIPRSFPPRLASPPLPKTPDAPIQTLQATFELLEGPDWGVNVDLCDLVNSDFHRFGKDAVKALKLKMLKTPMKPAVQLLALTALEMCMKNCG